MKKDTQKPTGGNGLRTFDFQGVPIRTLLVDGDTEPWFVASDVAKILGYSNPREAVRTHCKGGREMLTPSKGGLQKTKVIREGDLYRLICNSNEASIPGTAEAAVYVLESIPDEGEEKDDELRSMLDEAQLEWMHAATEAQIWTNHGCAWVDFVFPSLFGVKVQRGEV